MKARAALRRPLRPARHARPPHAAWAFGTLLLLTAAFLAGSVCGAIVGTGRFAVGEPVLPGDGSVYGYDSFFGLFFSCCKYHLAALFFSTSLLGAALIPATMACRGFVLSCTVASIASAYPAQCWALTAVVLGLPAAFSVPGLFLAGFEGMRFSGRLLSLFLRRPPAPVYPRSGERVLAAFLLSAAAAAAELLLVPALVRLIL